MTGSAVFNAAAGYVGMVSPKTNRLARWQMPGKKKGRPFGLPCMPDLTGVLVEAAGIEPASADPTAASAQSGVGDDFGSLYWIPDPAESATNLAAGFNPG